MKTQEHNIVTHKKVVLENNATSLTYINGSPGFIKD